MNLSLKACRSVFFLIFNSVWQTGASGRNSYLDVMLKMAEKYKKKMWGWVALWPHLFGKDVGIFRGNGGERILYGSDLSAENCSWILYPGISLTVLGLEVPCVTRINSCIFLVSMHLSSPVFTRDIQALINQIKHVILLSCYSTLGQYFGLFQGLADG